MPLQKRALITALAALVMPLQERTYHDAAAIVMPLTSGLITALLKRT